MAGLIEVDVVGVRTKVLTEQEAAEWDARFGSSQITVPAGEVHQPEEQIVVNPPDPRLRHCVVLKEKDGERELVMFMGMFEATAISLARQGIQTQRPMTHDLMRDLISALDDVIIERVVVTRLEDTTFYAEIRGTHHDEPLTIDSRPSDAIAVAIRLAVPVYVSETVPPFSRAA